MKQWFRFSLRTFLVLVTLFGGWLALKVRHVQLQKHVEKRVQALGGQFRYTHETKAYRIATRDGRLVPPLRVTRKRKSQLELFLGQQLSDAYVGTIGYVTVSGEGVTDADIQRFARIKTYRWLSFHNTSVSDDGLKHLKNMRELEWLAVDGSQVTDAGVKQLKSLRQLKNLILAKQRITDAGVEAIAENFPNLEMLHLGGTQVTDQGVEKILEDLPKLKRLELKGSLVSKKRRFELEMLIRERKE